MSTSPWTPESPSRDGTTSHFASPEYRGRPSTSVIEVSGALFIPGTSSSEPMKVWDATYVHGADATVSGRTGWDAEVEPEHDPEPDTTRQVVSELRRISGLTWEQLGQLFEVSRRSVHFWASGKPLNAENEARLMRVIDVVREADRGSARVTRATLLQAHQGKTPFDMLVEQRFDEARVVLGKGTKRSVPVLTELSATAKAERRPLTPQELFDAKSERIHREVGRARIAQTVRNTQREHS